MLLRKMRPLSRPDFNTSKPSRPGAFARRGWPNFWTSGCGSRRPCAYRQMAPLGRWIKARRSISIAANSMPGGPKLSSPAIGWSLPTDCIRQRSSRLGCQHLDGCRRSVELPILSTHRAKSNRVGPIASWSPTSAKPTRCCGLPCCRSSTSCWPRRQQTMQACAGAVAQNLATPGGLR